MDVPEFFFIKHSNEKSVSYFRPVCSFCDLIFSFRFDTECFIDCYLPSLAVGNVCNSWPVFIGRCEVTGVATCVGSVGQDNIVG